MAESTSSRLHLVSAYSGLVPVPTATMWACVGGRSTGICLVQTMRYRGIDPSFVVALDEESGRGELRSAALVLGWVHQLVGLPRLRRRWQGFVLHDGSFLAGITTPRSLNAVLAGSRGRLPRFEAVRLAHGCVSSVLRPPLAAA